MVSKGGGESSSVCRRDVAQAAPERSRVRDSIESRRQSGSGAALRSHGRRDAVASKTITRCSAAHVRVPDPVAVGGHRVDDTSLAISATSHCRISIATLEANTLVPGRAVATPLDEMFPVRRAQLSALGGFSVCSVERPDVQPTRPFDSYRDTAMSPAWANSRESFPLTSAVREDRIAGG